MAIKMISVKCPECGASMTIEGDRKKAFCTYCGAQIILYNENEYTININNEAEIKRAETDQMVNLRKMDFAEKAMQATSNRRTIRVIINLALLAIGILMILVGYGLNALVGENESLEMIGILGTLPILGAGYMFLDGMGKEYDDDNPYDERVTVPDSINGYWSMNYQAAEEILVGAGFTNVSSIGLGDLAVGLLYKPGKVDSITINGKRINTGGKKYPRDAKIVISYHSHK
jgi:endogenous inhibitor of DNA gyrase (YacG/DUF329 family)